MINIVYGSRLEYEFTIKDHVLIDEVESKIKNKLKDIGCSALDVKYTLFDDVSFAVDDTMRNKEYSFEQLFIDGNIPIRRMSSCISYIVVYYNYVINGEPMIYSERFYFNRIIRNFIDNEMFDGTEDHYYQYNPDDREKYLKINDYIAEYICKKIDKTIKLINSK